MRACTPGTPSTASRARISAAARAVKVTASTCRAEISPVSTRWAIREVIARVLPVPAPARMQTGPAGAVTADRCSRIQPGEDPLRR